MYDRLDSVLVSIPPDNNIANVRFQNDLCNNYTTRVKWSDCKYCRAGSALLLDWKRVYWILCCVIVAPRWTSVACLCYREPLFHWWLVCATTMGFMACFSHLAPLWKLIECLCDFDTTVGIHSLLVLLVCCKRVGVLGLCNFGVKVKIYGVFVSLWQNSEWILTSRYNHWRILLRLYDKHLRLVCVTVELLWFGHSWPVCTNLAPL